MPRGALSRVAEQLGVTPHFVSYVARGQRRSERIEKALAEYMRTHPPDPDFRVPREILRGFPSIQVCIARRLNVLDSTVNRVVSGRDRSRRIEKALFDEAVNRGYKP
ncbi:MAG TPA: hypothetical protein VFB79_18745 [Candidatus Angelobacter sp.]|nr:hypothetical protein [Candidatus Angelobacter sp.]